MVPRNLPKVAPVTEKERDVDESIIALEARLAALEAAPHVGNYEYHSVEADPGVVAVRTDTAHGLGRKPVGAVYVGMGVPGEADVADCIVTLSHNLSDDKNAAVWLQLGVGGAGTVRTYHFLLF